MHMSSYQRYELFNLKLLSRFYLKISYQDLEMCRSSSNYRTERLRVLQGGWGEVYGTSAVVR